MMWRAGQWTWWVGELQNNSKVDAKNAPKSDIIQNQLIKNSFLLFKERLILL